MSRWLNRQGLYLAWLLVLLGTGGSLYISEVLAIPVCHLCWYQRICLYPLVIILGVALCQSRKDVFHYAFPFSCMGFIFAVYQYLEQMIPGFSPIDLCGVGISCSVVHVKLLGFITLPFMAAGLFLIVSVLLYLQRSPHP